SSQIVSFAGEEHPFVNMAPVRRTSRILCQTKCNQDSCHNSMNGTQAAIRIRAISEVGYKQSAISGKVAEPATQIRNDFRMMHVELLGNFLVSSSAIDQHLYVE